MDTATHAPTRPTDLVYDRDFIVIYRGLDPAVCDAIVQKFDGDPAKHRGRIGAAGNARYAQDTKVSWDLEIGHEGAWGHVFRDIHGPIQACIAEYLSRSPILQSFPLQATGYKIQMYARNEGHFRWHADSVGGGSGERVVAMVLYLNDVERGGETEFFHQGLKIAPKAGQLVLFPAGWNYMHAGTNRNRATSTSSRRSYGSSIDGWRRQPADCSPVFIVHVRVDLRLHMRGVESVPTILVRP